MWGAAGSFLVGVLAVAITFGIVYWIARLPFDGVPMVPHSVALAVAVVVLVLLFVGNARRERGTYEPYTVTTVPRAGERITFEMPGLGMGTYANPHAPDTLWTGARLVADVLFTGPRILSAVARMVCKARRLRTLDVDGAARVLAFLLSREHRASFAEIILAVEGINPVTLFPSLRDIDGVLFLTSEPPGLALSDDLREEMRHGVT